MTPRIIAPGATIGVLGGGQLGRMFAMAARRLGYRVHTFAPEHDTPPGQNGDIEVTASYDDVERLHAFARGVDVVTFEFENVSAAAVAAAEAHAIVRPNGRALEIAQHRIREKVFLRDRGLPLAPFAPVRSDVDLEDAVRLVGRPAVIKCATFRPEGKTQVPILLHDDPLKAWDALGRSEAILEAFIDIEREISVVGARGVHGSVATFAPIENAHHQHILDFSVAPANVPAAIASQALEVTRAVLEGLDYVGVVCVEFFVAKDGRLLVNELTPRPHNSGHLTFDACRTGQFEQQVRAICGLPLGSPELIQPAAMANLLGDLWATGEPNWAAALALPDVKLHLYGKTVPRRGRKMGHLTVLAPTTKEARARVLEAREALRNR